MKKKYPWKAIRARYEAGENCSVLSRMYGGSPTKEGIRQRAKREGWLSISKDTKQAVRNLPSLQDPYIQRATSKELGKRTEGNARLILAAFERGASPKIAAGVVGLTLDKLKKWMNDDEQFAMEILSRSAQVSGELLCGIGGSIDWRSWKFLLEHSPFSREEFGPKPVEREFPTIRFNTHDGTLYGKSLREASETDDEPGPTPKAIEPADEPEPILQTQQPPNEEPEPALKLVSWQGMTIEEKLEVEEQALEQRVMDAKKYNTN